MEQMAGLLQINLDYTIQHLQLFIAILLLLQQVIGQY
jgi:hypothetical protein